jgi:gluconate 2-dehydrogenase subunit 3-like protein
MDSKSDHLSRRTWFHILGSAPVLAGAAIPAIAEEAHHHAHAQPAAQATPASASVFNDHQRKTVAVLSDLIIPRDERSGSATEAGVPAFIEDWLAFRTQEDGTDRMEAEVLGGLTWLDRESRTLFDHDFADANPDQQKQILDRIAWAAKAAKEDRPWAAFFSTFRNLTVSGFFSSKMGVADLPYLGNTVVTEWKGCDPAVWRVIEDRMQNGYKGLFNPKNQG